MFKLKIIDNFAAAHRLSMVTEKCENLHGHNWKVEVCITGEPLNEAGILIDFGIIKRNLREVIKQLDHKFLNDLEHFDNGSPSSENIASYIAKQLKGSIGDSTITVSEVSVWESENACATYILPTVK